MEYDRKLLQDVKRLMIVRYPRFGAQIAATNLEYKTDLKYHTASTDGKNIYFDPDYLASLSDDDKLFIIAHELMHVKFEHMYRIMGKDGQIRDPKLWNIATDAIINANLERDGFKIKEGYVNMPEALNYSAEEFYEKLLKERQEQQQKQSRNGQNQGQNGDGQQDKQNGGGNDQSGQESQEQNKQGGSQKQQGQNSEQNDAASQQIQGGQGQEQSQDKGQEQGAGSGQQFADDHSLWDKAFKESKEQENGQEQKSGQNSKPSQSQTSKNSQLDPNVQIPEFEESQFDERAEFQENRIERRERARRNMERMRDKELKKSESGGNIQFGAVGEAKAILDWKLLLRREVEKTETIWSQRRSIAENNYAYRLEENDVEDQAETEVMIDVSGSVSLEMVKAFLRQLKPILRESKLKVGCFNEKFWGMVEIKSNKDIDNFEIPLEARGDSAWTEDWDLAVRSFSKKREVNKIVFTDGEPCPGTMPKEDLKGTNVIWLVYGNRDFNPCCGKVIDVYPKDLQNLINAERASAEPELSM